MRLLRLGKQKWSVLACMNDRGDCDVLDLLESSGIPGERMLSDLKESIPERGVPRNAETSKNLRDKIFELREPVKKGGTLRVLYFYAEGYVIVCANGVLKKKDKTPDALIDAAVNLRKQFESAYKKKQIEIVELTADEASDGDDNADK